MKTKTILILMTLLTTLQGYALELPLANSNQFDKEHDILIMQFDCKTDVDDIHATAAFATLLTNSTFCTIHFHAVAGTYGIQKGAYVPPNKLFDITFKKADWTDANQNFEKAVARVKAIAEKTLSSGDDVWIAEAGQSDFTAALLKAIQADQPKLKTKQHIHVVQHSNWNEKETDPMKLKFVIAQTDYQKIPDGNHDNNGTPDYQTTQKLDVQKLFTDPYLIKIWQCAKEIANTYNGKEKRYKNKTIANGGVDFSDLVEVGWILGINDIKDSQQFFKRYAH